MSGAWRKVSSSRWSRVRAVALQRDGYVCQLRLPGCQGTATQVDHIVPVSVDIKLAYTLENLRAACRACNNRRNRRRPGRDWTPTPW